MANQSNNPFEFTYIDRPEQLDDLLERLADCRFLAVDTESSNFFSYYPRMCLIQLTASWSEGHDAGPSPGDSASSSGQKSAGAGQQSAGNDPKAAQRLARELERVAHRYENYIIDTLALEAEQIHRLATLFENPEMEKIFHSAVDDLAAFGKEFGLNFHSVFDTQLAARYLGEEGQMSLGKLVERHFGYKMDKKYQKSNWMNRPLEHGQLEYAIKDTVFLAGIRHIQMARLRERPVLEEFQEHLRQLSRQNFEGGSEAEGNEDHRWMKPARKYKLPPGERRLFQVLYDFRTRNAQNMDIAPFRIIGDRELTDIANWFYRKRRELAKKAGESPDSKDLANWQQDRLVEARGRWSRFRRYWKNSEDLMERLEQAWREGPMPHFPRLEGGERFTSAEGKLIKKIQEYRDKMARRRRLEGSLLFQKKNATRLLKYFRDELKPGWEERLAEADADWARNIDWAGLFDWSPARVAIYKEDLPKLADLIRRGLEEIDQAIQESEKGNS